MVSFSIVDFDLLLQDRYNIEAYKTYITVIDSNGNIISKPFEIKGYTINDIALGDFGRGKPDIVITLSDTWPTTYNGQKIVAFDYLGNILFNTALSDYNDLIQCLTIGDVNGDSLSEVIVNYRPRWYNENPSGFQIYDKKGVLVKELEIPTLGEVDDYWGGEPILTDFNNDGKIDIVQQSLFIPLNGINRLTYKTRIYALDLNSVYNEENIDWPMLLHDPQHTGLYKQPSTCGSSCINANMVGCCCDIGGDYDAWQKNQCYASPYKKVDVSNCEVSPTTCSWYCNSYDYSYGEIKGDACCCYNVSTTTTTTTVKTTTTTSTTTTLPNMSTTTTTTVPESVTVTYQISASDNDAYSGSTYLRNTDPDIFPAYTWYKNGLRWKIDIPPGSTIDSAYVKVFQYLFSGNSYTSTARLQLFTQCSSFDTVFWNWGVDSKYVDWQITFQNSASWITSPDIKTLIQDFINRPSYVKGSYLCLRLYNSTVNNGNGRFRTYDFSSNYGSKLEITYSSGITTTTSTSTTIGTTTTTTSTSTTINTSTTTEPTTSTTILTTTTTAISTSTTSSTTTTTSTTIVPITTTVPATTTTIPVTTTTIPVGQTKTYQISASYDDTYATSGSNYQTRNYVTFMSTMHGFLRWSIDIPPGSTINSAKVKVVAYSSDSSSYNVKFYLLNYADCVDFTSNPFSRTTTGTEVSWQTGIWTAETEYTSSDIKNLIQEFINMPGYNSGNHICLKIMHYGSNNKYFYSFEGSNTKAAKLEVTYTPQSTSLGILVHVFEKLITDIRNLFSFKPS